MKDNVFELTTFGGLLGNIAGFVLLDESAFLSAAVSSTFCCFFALFSAFFSIFSGTFGGFLTLSDLFATSLELIFDLVRDLLVCFRDLGVFDWEDC